jgi:cytolysin (calcineurin-like family phosphatase)
MPFVKLAPLLLLTACVGEMQTPGDVLDGALDPVDAERRVDATPGTPDAPPVVDPIDGAPPIVSFDASPPPPPPPPPPLDVTFYVVSDTHADPPQDSYDLRAMSRAIDAASQHSWPATIGGQVTGFVGGAIAPARGVVFLGDITGWGTAPSEIQTFRRYFEKGASDVAIHAPSYVGLGNHDVDSADRPPDLAATYRAMYWKYVADRHKGGPVPATRFDAASHAYSFDFDGVHLVQGHRFFGDTGYGLPSGLGFLADDLAEHASDGRPVFLFHHYGMDPFGTQDRWWTKAQRDAYRDVIAGYNVPVIFVGHSHAAFQYDWEGRHVIQVNNAKAEHGTGNNDGNGSFAIARVTDGRVDVVTCRWLDDQGHVELIAPFYSQTW